MTSALLAVLLFAAAASDLRSRRIPNWLIVVGIGGAFGAHAMSMANDMAPLAGVASWSPLAGLATGFALLLPLYLLRATGAGDVKLMAAVGAFVGASNVLSAALYTLLAGGLLSLLYMLERGVANELLANLRSILPNRARRAVSGMGVSTQTTAVRLPYAVAIALGTTAALLWPLQPMLNGGAR